MQSVCSEQKLNALAASFIHSPVGENVDWKLSATISPCHVTVIPYSLGHERDGKVERERGSFTFSGIHTAIRAL